MHRIWTLDRTQGRMSIDPVGDRDANLFDSREAAEAMIEQLRKIGPEWADAEYEVREASDDD